MRNWGGCEMGEDGLLNAGHLRQNLAEENL
jgi:hypothetical protein